jgi:hypothetical protein
VNVNVNLNGVSQGVNNGTKNHNSRNTNQDNMYDKITVLKRSVDKYSEEAKKKIESQILRSTINNDSILTNLNLTKTLNNNNSNKNMTGVISNNNLSNRNLVDVGKEIIFKKVNPSSSNVKVIKR